METTEPKINLGFNLVQIRHNVLGHENTKMPLPLLSCYFFPELSFKLSMPHKIIYLCLDDYDIWRCLHLLSL